MITKRVPRKVKKKFKGYVSLDDYGYFPRIINFPKGNLSSLLINSIKSCEEYYSTLNKKIGI